MPKTNSSPLYLLISSLSKAEKRHFKLYARRTFGDKDMKFLTLFDLLDRNQELANAQLESKLKGTKGSALSNLKSHLYEQLLISLRLLHHNDRSIRIDELVSFAKVLYIKGLYLQSLDQLRKARVIATTYQNHLALYQILEMERKIELFFVTESGYERARDIVSTNVEIRDSLQSLDQWSNLALMLYDYYLKFGHVKNQRQFRKVAIYFKNEIATISNEKISTHGTVYRHMAYTWFHFITQSFAICYKHACSWVQEMRSNPILIEEEPIMYLKGLHNILSALFYSNKPRQFDENYAVLIDFLDKNEASFDPNTTITANIYRHIAGLNQRFLQGDFRNKETLIKEVTDWLEANDNYLDQNRIQVFYYKIACLYFGADDFKNTIKFLNKIIHTDSKESHLRQDVQCFARVLNLVAHYELGNYELVEYQLKSTYRFLIKYGDLQKVQLHIIEFIRKSVHMNRNEMTEPFGELKNQLIVVFNDPFERRPLLYLDLISWLSSKLEGVPVEEVIHKRQLLRRGKTNDQS
jgi:hypothetical protein